MLDALCDLVVSFLQAVVFALIGTVATMLVLAIIFKVFTWWGIVCDLIREWALYWWAVVTLALLPRDSKTARELRCRHDLHDWCDGQPYEPWHFHVYCCDRCGKRFTI